MQELNSILKVTGIKAFKDNQLQVNMAPANLIQETILQGNGQLSKDGALLIKTGKHTGRAAKDKYIVKTEDTTEKVWWDNDVKEMSLENFESIKTEILQHILKQEKIYFSEHNVSSLPEYQVSINLLSTHPEHTLFAHHLFRQDKRLSENEPVSILHAPDLELDKEKYGLRSGTVITTFFEEKIILIAGTLYSGEIKKSIFSYMNFFLPNLEILPMHCGSNQGEKGDVSIFFGLSGTGKTTLSTDLGRKLIGDDEHGIGEKGTFNFEGGCYAKTYKLTKGSEPEIFEAVNRFGSIIENVTFNQETKQIDFFDNSITENGRASYDLKEIEERVESAYGKLPNHIFFLSADAFGILPPVSKLSINQALFYFISGYTAKLAGTEIGITTPEATFSTCFGAPFMLRHPKVYASLLEQHLSKSGANVWLINTGWIGGAYGNGGDRISLPATRQIIRSIQHGNLENIETEKLPIFNLDIPKNVKGVSREILNPVNHWPNKDDYIQSAQNLAEMFLKNINNFPDIQDYIIKNAPNPKDF